MGCDVHAHIEVLVDGTWEHWHVPKINRDHQLFGRMAGVRQETEPHPPVRGLPPDITRLTRMDYMRQAGDAHHASWLTSAEFCELHAWVEAHFPEYHTGHGWHKVVGYLFGDGYGSRQHVQDVRLVFWFDG
jgi:hypothetical protein